MSSTDEGRARRRKPLKLAAMAQPELVEAASRETGLTEHTALVRYSLAVVAGLDNPEQYAQHVKPGPRGPRRRETGPSSGGQTT